MKLSEEVFTKALNKGIISLYEEELIEKLRNLNYCGLPLSIILLCKEFCNGECYRMSMNISRAMEHFTLVHGDVNFLPLNNEYPNHSWVEKDGFVYDTSNGFKWNKDLYYLLFEPKIREVYNEESVKDYKDYKEVLKHADDIEDMTSMKLIIQYIEFLETENPTLNYKRLQQEIDIWREKNSVFDRLPDKVIRQYKKSLMNTNK